MFDLSVDLRRLCLIIRILDFKLECMAVFPSSVAVSHFIHVGNYL